MFSVRIDKDRDAYVFRVEPSFRGFEMVALDATPGVIAFVEADDPGQAAARAWNMAVHMHDEQPGQLDGAAYLELLLEKP
jgi:hypothetical protein